MGSVPSLRFLTNLMDILKRVNKSNFDNMVLKEANLVNLDENKCKESF